MGNFLNFWAVPLGIAGLALPVVIHWLTRPRPVTMPLSTVRFVVEALRQNAWWHRVRDWLLLLLRAAAVALIAAAMARPLLESKPQVASSDTAGAVRIVVLDASHSMAAVENGIQVFERARAEAAGYLRQRSGYRANLILAGATPRSVFPEASNNLAALRKQLSEARPLEERLVLERTLELAAQMLASTSDQQRPELVLVSDFQRGNWSAADFSVLPENTKIELVGVGAAQSPANAAVTAIRCNERPSADRPVPVEVELANYSPLPQRLQVQLTCGQQTESAHVDCPAGGKATATLPIRAGADGWRPITARLVDHVDALPGDDQRSLVLNVRRAPRMALVTREDPHLQATASYFMDRALSARDLDDQAAPIDVAWHDPGSIKPDTLSTVNAVLVVRPGRLEQDLARRLVLRMRSGTPMWYVASDAVDARNLEQLVAIAGEELQPPATLVPPPRNARRDALSLADFRNDQPPFAAFGDRLAPLLTPLRFSGGLASRRTEHALAEDILATYSDGSIGLYSTPCGRGSLTVWNVDLVQSNLPGSAAFVPWVAELAGHLLRDQRSMSEPMSGERLVARLPPAVRDPTPLRLAGPAEIDGPLGELRASDQGVVWEWDRAGAPGVYRVVDDEGQAVYAASVVLPTVESDLAAIDAAVLTNRLSGGRAIHFQAAGDRATTDDSTWSWLAAGCVACLLMEFLALAMFRV